MRNQRHANYEVLMTDPVLIRDVGPWDQYPTVTNVAEDVVRELVAAGHLSGTGEEAVRYLDSAGELDRLRVLDGAFISFASGPGWSEAEAAKVPRPYLGRARVHVPRPPEDR